MLRLRSASLSMTASTLPTPVMLSEAKHLMPKSKIPNGYSSVEIAAAGHWSHIVRV